MNTEKLNSWLAILANFGILISIVFLAVQVQQTRDAVLGATYYARASDAEDWSKWMADSDHIAATVTEYSKKDFSDLSPLDQERIQAAVEGAFHRLDGIYYEYQLGLISQEYYDTTFRSMMEDWAPRWKATGFLDRGWVVPRPAFRKEIEKYMNGQLKK